MAGPRELKLTVAVKAFVLGALKVFRRGFQERQSNGMQRIVESKKASRRLWW